MSWDTAVIPLCEFECVRVRQSRSRVPPVSLLPVLAPPTSTRLTAPTAPPTINLCSYRARRLADGREYALKVTDLDRLPPWSQQAAVREARVLSALGGGGGSAAEAAPRGTAGAPHPCLATYRESFCLGSRLCIVTEVAQGGDLKRLLE